MEGGSLDAGSADGDSDVDDPKRLCIDEEGGNLQCPKCPYLAKWKSDLERHLKVRIMFCTVMLSRQKEEIIFYYFVLMKVHSEDKNYSCSVCYKSYKYQGDLNVHMRRAHAAGHIRSPKQSSHGVPTTMCKTPPPNVQVLSNEV